MAVAANNDVVMQHHTERLGDVGNFACHFDIGLRWRGVARGVIMHKDQRRCIELKRSAHHFARIDRRMINRAALLDLIGNQTMLARQ